MKLFTSVLVMVLLRFRTNILYNIYICVYIYIIIISSCGYRSWQVPRSSVWVDRRTNGLFVVRVQRPETQKSLWHSSSSKANRLMTQEEPTFQYESKAKKNLMSQFKGSQTRGISLTRDSFVLFRLFTDWIKSTHTREGNLLYTVYNFKY